MIADCITIVVKIYLSLSFVNLVAPSRADNCAVFNRTSTSLHVKCKPGYNGGTRQWFIMEVYDKWTLALTRNVTSFGNPEFIANNLPSHKDFSIRIYAVNKQGKSISVGLNSSTLRDPQKQTGELNV